MAQPSIEPSVPVPVMLLQLLRSPTSDRSDSCQPTLWAKTLEEGPNIANDALVANNTQEQSSHAHSR